MDITCPSCGTEYEFDDAKVSVAGVTVKCTSCSYTFKVRKRAVVETTPLGSGGSAGGSGAVAAAAAPAGDGALPTDGKKLWMIRTTGGQLLKFKELPTLQQWIVERKVKRDDEISRSGETWKRLGDIAELASFFQVVDAAQAAEISQPGRGGPSPIRATAPIEARGEPAPAAAGQSPVGRLSAAAGGSTVGASAAVEHEEAATDQYGGGGGGGGGGGDDQYTGAGDGPSGPASLGRAARTTGSEPAFTAGTKSFNTVGRSAAWEGGGERVGDIGDDDVRVPRRRSGKMVGSIVVAVILIGVGVFAVVKKDMVKRLLGIGGPQVSEAYRQGRELFLKDDEASLKAADAKLAQAPKDSAMALAARAEVDTTWAQHLRDNAELLERRAQQLTAKAAAMPAPEPKKHTRHHRRRHHKKKKAAAHDQSNDKQKYLDEAKVLQLQATKLRDEATQKLAAAVAPATAAYKKAPNQAEVQRALADLRRMQGKKGPAVLDLLNNALKSKPNDPETFYVQGAYFAGVGNQAKAIDLLKDAMVKTRAYTKKGLLRAAMALAMIHLRAGRRTEARELAKSVLAASPNHAWAKVLLEQIELEDQGGAALDAGSGSGTAAGSGSSAGSGTGSSAPVAAGTTAGTTAKHPTPPTHHHTGGALVGSYAQLVKIGTRHSEHGRTMAALAAFQAALKKNSRGVEAITGQAFCQLDLQRFAQAIAGFRRAMNIKPTYGDAMIGAAEAYKGMGNKRRALDYYKAYLRANPGGAKANLAKRNAKALERQLGVSAPGPKPVPTPPPTKTAPPTPPPTKTAPPTPPPTKTAPPAPAPAPAPGPAAKAPAPATKTP